MLRVLPITGFALVFLTLVGCAGTWDTITSRKFRREPFHQTYRLINPEDPFVVLRANPPRDGDERAKAMRRLKEPLANKGSQEDQDFVVDLLARTATADTSPVLRLAAISTLGRFEDPRATGILVLAYQTAHGRPAGTPAPAASPIQQVSATSRQPGRGPVLGEVPLTGPTGFAPDTVAAIRCQAAESLGRTSKPEAVRFLSQVAAGPGTDTTIEGAEDREIRLAAIRGLGKCREPEAVVALAQVLGTESGKRESDDLVRRTHEGLVYLTGKKLPPDPQEWQAVVQAGVVIAPEPNWLDGAVEHAVGWVKP